MSLTSGMPAWQTRARRQSMENRKRALLKPLSKLIVLLCSYTDMGPKLLLPNWQHLQRDPRIKACTITYEPML